MADEFLSKIRLKDSKEVISFRPFKVTSSINALLKPIIEAFLNADKVSIGYSTLEKNKGLVKPTLKKKNLYLTGGALRDHLQSITKSNYDVVTDATPDEIIMILNNAETNFIFLSTKEEAEPTDIIFYPSRFDDENNIMELTVEKNGQKVFLSTLNLNNKDRLKNVKKSKFTTSIEQDSKTRDITINALYLKLKNPDGDNSELLDPVGGAHDLRSGQIVTIGHPEEALKRYPYLGFRLASICTRFSHDKKIPDKIIDAMKTMGNLDLDPHILKDIFVKVVEDTTSLLDPYLQNLSDSGMMLQLFPECMISDLRPDLPNNKITLIAYLLYKNSSEKIKKTLNRAGFSNQDIDEILSLCDVAHESISGKISVDDTQKHFRKPSRLPQNRIEEFIRLFNKVSSRPSPQKVAEIEDMNTDTEISPNIDKYIKRME